MFSLRRRSLSMPLVLSLVAGTLALLAAAQAQEEAAAAATTVETPSDSEVTPAAVPPVTPPATCFTSGDIVGSVLGTFFSTLAAVAIAFLLYWYFRRQGRTGKSIPLQSKTSDVEAHAYDNPYFQDDELDKGGKSSNPPEKEKDAVDGKTATLPDANKTSSATKAKKTKPLKSNPFSVFHNKGHLQRALDDSFINQEPEKMMVRLRGIDFTGLGFNICGNMRDGIFVRDVLHRGPAMESGKIKAGDRILSVTVSCANMVYEDALTILSYASPYDVSLEIQKMSEKGAYIPGHQKKGSTASTASTVLVNGGERLTHPLYRSQSSDDLTQIGRDGTGTKRSLSMGVTARLNKDKLVKPSHSLREESISEGSIGGSIDDDGSRSSRLGFSKHGNLQSIDDLSKPQAEVKVIVHNEDSQTGIELPELMGGATNPPFDLAATTVMHVVSETTKEEEKKTKKSGLSSNPFDIRVKLPSFPFGKKSSSSKITLETPSLSLPPDVNSSSRTSNAEGSVSINMSNLKENVSSQDQTIDMASTKAELALPTLSISANKPHINSQENTEYPSATISMPTEVTNIDLPSAPNLSLSNLSGEFENKTSKIESSVNDIKATVDSATQKVKGAMDQVKATVENSVGELETNVKTVTNELQNFSPKAHLDNILANLPGVQGRAAADGMDVSSGSLLQSVLADLPDLGMPDQMKDLSGSADISLDDIQMELPGLEDKNVESLNLPGLNVKLPTLNTVENQQMSVNVQNPSLDSDNIEVNLPSVDIQMPQIKMKESATDNQELAVNMAGFGLSAKNLSDGLNNVGTKLQELAGKVENTITGLETTFHIPVASVEANAASTNNDVALEVAELPLPDVSVSTPKLNLLGGKPEIASTDLNVSTENTIQGNFPGTEPSFNFNELEKSSDLTQSLNPAGINFANDLVEKIPTADNVNLQIRGPDLTADISGLVPDVKAEINAECNIPHVSVSELEFEENKIENQHEMFIEMPTILPQRLANKQEKAGTEYEISLNTEKPGDIVSLPRVDIKVPSAADFEAVASIHAATPVMKEMEANLPSLPDVSVRKGPFNKDKAPPPPINKMEQPNVDYQNMDTLNESIAYFENKVQKALQKSPKAKPKRIAIPGKRRAPPPPNQKGEPSSDEMNFSLSTPRTSLEADMGYPSISSTVSANEVLQTNGSSFGLSPAYQVNYNPFRTFEPSEDPMPSLLPETNGDPSASVLFNNTANITTVHVGPEPLSVETETVLQRVNGWNSPKKILIKGEGSLGLQGSGFKKTNFFEGLDKAGDEELDLIPEAANSNISNAQGKATLTTDRNSNRRSSSLGDLTKLEETVSKPLLLERAVSMDLNHAEAPPSGQLMEQKKQIHDEILEQPDSSDEILLANKTQNHEVEVQIEKSDDKKQGSEQCNDHEAASNKSSKKFNLIQGLFKKDKGAKRKKDENGKKSKIPVPVTTIHIGREDKVVFSSPDGSHPRKDEFSDVSLSDKEMSISSSSLSGDSIEDDGEKTKKPSSHKRKLIPVDSRVTASGSDSDGAETSKTNATEHFNSVDEDNESSHKQPRKEHPNAVLQTSIGGTTSVQINIPVIPPIITNRELRPPSRAEPEPDDGEMDGNDIPSTRRGVNSSGPVRSLSPTKFPRIWPVASGDDGKPKEENGESNDEHNGTTYHYKVIYDSEQPEQGALSVQTTHVTLGAPHKATTDPYTACAVMSEGAISKTVIIPNPQLFNTHDVTTGPESPPPTLQPPE